MGHKNKRKIQKNAKKKRAIYKKTPLDIFQWIVSVIQNLFTETKVDTPHELLNDVAKGTKSALLIGSNFIGTNYPLSGCINDLNNMKIFLTDKGFENIIMIADDLSLKPNKETVIRELTTFLKTTSKNETLYVHFSCHGTQINTLDKGEVDGLDECICTCEDDNSIDIIADNELNDIIKNNLATDATLYIVFDCCHSGSILDLKYTYSDTLCKWFKSTIIKDTTECGQIIMFSGCKDYQTSADARIPDTDKNTYSYQGALTYSLLNTINVEKEKEIGKIYNKTLEYLCNNDYNQHPMLCTNKPFNVSSIFL